MLAGSAPLQAIRYERDRDQKTIRVGRFRAYRIHAGLAPNEGEELFDVCDSHSAEMHEVVSLLYERGGRRFKDGIVRRFDAIRGPAAQAGCYTFLPVHRA